ncbi:MAG: hypothetical protein ACI87E_003730, partial [Mariniblastus sp.]
MKNKPGWLVVILISSVQLVLLLVAAMVLPTWFMNQTEETVGRQACDENIALTQQIASAIENAEIQNIRESGQDLDSLHRILAEIDVPNEGFAYMIDAQNGQTLSHGSNASTPFGFAEVSLRPLALNSALTIPLLNSISSQQGLRHIDGRAILGEREHFVSGEYLTELDSILLIGQPTQTSLAGIAHLVRNSKDIVFGFILLMGLIGLSLITMILNRTSTSVDNLSYGLEQQVTQREMELVKTQNAVIFG